MRTFDPGKVESSGVVSNQQTTGKAHLWARLRATLDECARAVGDPCTTFEVVANFGMLLPLLKFIKRRQIRVVVAQGHYIANRDLVVVTVVKIRAGCCTFCSRPPRSVNNKSLLVLGGVDIPDFLEAETVMLRVAALIQLERSYKLLPKMPPTAFSEYCIFGVELHSRHVRVPVTAIGSDAHVAGGDTLHASIIVKKNL